MKLIRFMILSLLSFTLFACSFGSNNSSTTKAELEDREKFMREYGVIFGLYEGAISNRPSEKVELSLYPIDVPDGKDERGQQRVKLAAKARMRWLNSTQSDIFLDVRYTAETADIQMTNEASATASATDNAKSSRITFVVRGQVSGETISGVVVRNGGTLGTLNVRLKSRESTAPPEGDVGERNERLRRLYEPLVGNYTGQTRFADGSSSLKFYMRFYIAEAPFTDGSFGPVLLSYYRRFDDPGGVLELIFDSDYSTQTSPPSLTMISRPYANPESTYRIMINARVNGNTMTGSFQQNHQGNTGEVVITRMKKGGVIPPKKAK